MAINDPDPKSDEPRPHYRWPWLVLAAFILAVALAILWMSKEIGRTRRIRDLNSPPAQTGGENATPKQNPLPTPAAATGTNGMVWIPPGKFWMGSEDGQPDEKPIHEVALDG